MDEAIKAMRKKARKQATPAEEQVTQEERQAAKAAICALHEDPSDRLSGSALDAVAQMLGVMRMSGSIVNGTLPETDSELRARVQQVIGALP